MHLVLAANVEVDQPWVAEATADFARKTGATVAVVAVDEVELERLAPVPRSVYTAQAEEAAARAQKRLSDAGVAATSTVLQGLAREQVLAFADQQQADVIVVGASSRPTVAARLLGNVPHAMLARAARPVLVIPHPQTA